jgi:uncharacterized protein (TIGR02145 family)
MNTRIARKGVACYAPTIFTAILAFALALTFNGCSGDGGSDNGGSSSSANGGEGKLSSSSDPDGSSSSSSNEGEGELSSSSGTDGSSSSSSNESNSSSGTNNGSGSVKKDKISGFFQKGPFIKGSTATLYELDNSFAQTGRSFRDIIADDKGSFEIKNVELVSHYAMLEADGFYRNEVTGKISAAPIKLYAIADIREKSNVNVNILTHLEYYRIQRLVESGKSLAEAKMQAQREILFVFGISDEFGNSEDMSIFGTGDGDAALLAISILLQGELSEGQFTERLTDFSIGFRETGVWNNETAKNAMADWAERASLTSVRNNILGWNLSPTVPAFEKFVSDYWYAKLGLEKCNAGLQDSIKSSSKGIYYICQDNAWRRATELEYDTYQWVCATNGEIKDGQVSGKKYICKNGIWQLQKYIDIKCLESNSCLTFKDARDNQSYVYVNINGQVWMAENLNYKASGSKNNEYGSFYDWETAKNVCPSGWHLPTNDDWNKLANYAGSGEDNIKKLMATGGWENGNGTDEFGFAALPGAGYYEDGTRGDDVGTDGLWYSATTLYAFGINGKNGIHSWLGTIDDNPSGKVMLPVRCLKN